MENQNNHKYVLTILGVTLLIILCVFGFIFFAFKIDERYYNETIQTIPNEYEVEEELEDIFITTDVKILETQKEYNYIIYTVLVDNEYCYLVSYKISRVSTGLLGSYKWSYYSHRLAKNI